VIVHLDTSSLAKLYIEEEGTPDVRADSNSYLAVATTPTLCREAGVLAERHRLRGFDSIHLASFVEILRSGAANVKFSSYDTALNRAAATVQRALRASRRAAGR
jgi:hypothetical protein